MCGAGSVGTTPTIATNATSLPGGGASTTTTSVAGASGGGALPTPPVSAAVAGASGGGALDSIAPLLSQVTAAIESLKQALAGNGLVGASPAPAPGVEGGGPGGKVAGAAGGCGCGMPGCGGGDAPPAPTQTPPTPEQKDGKGEEKAEGKGKKRGKGHDKARGKGHQNHGHAPNPGQGNPAQGGNPTQGGGPTPPAGGNPPAGNPPAGGNPPGGGADGGGPPAVPPSGGGFSTAPWQGVTGPGWYTWTSPDNKYHPAAPNAPGAKYYVRDGNGYKVGTPPSGGGFSTAPHQGITGPGWYTWTSPDNKYHAAAPNAPGAKYYVRDGNGYKVGTPPS